MTKHKHTGHGINLTDLQAYLEFFYNDERKAISEYAKFLDWMPNHPALKDLRKDITAIIKQEHEHFEKLKSYLNGFI